MPSRRPQRSRAGLFLIVAALGYGAYLLVFPGGGPAYEDLAFRPLPYVNYGFKPDFTRSGPEVRTTNSDGFRGPEIARPKPAGVYRIVCLGGSTTYTSFTDDDQTYPVLLEQELEQRLPGRDFEVINAGVESYTSAESLANLAFRCLDFEPDAVLVYHGANDVRPRRYPEFDSGYTPYRKVWDGGTDDYVKRSGELGGINTFIQHPPVPEGTDPMANLADHGPAVFRRNLASLAGLARAHDVRPIFVTFAASDDFELADRGVAPDASLRAGIREHNGVMRALCTERGLDLVDFAPRMTLTREMFRDQVHVTPAGSALKARLIAEGLADLLR